MEGQTTDQRTEAKTMSSTLFKKAHAGMINFLIYQPKHIFWEFKSAVSISYLLNYSETKFSTHISKSVLVQWEKPETFLWSFYGMFFIKAVRGPCNFKTSFNLHTLCACYSTLLYSKCKRMVIKCWCYTIYSCCCFLKTWNCISVFEKLIL